MVITLHPGPQSLIQIDGLPEIASPAYRPM